MEEIMYTEERSLYFDAKKRCYVLNFQLNTIEMRLCEFIALNKKLNSYNLELLIDDLSSVADHHLFTFEKNNIAIELTLLELIKLRNLFSETMFLMRLEDMLYHLSIELPTTATVEEQVFAK
jgi:hypothetical protein